MRMTIPPQLSDQLYVCLRRLYPTEQRIIGTHPMRVTELEGICEIQLYDDRRGVQYLSISTYLLAQDMDMTRAPLVKLFLRLMREALKVEERSNEN